MQGSTLTTPISPITALAMGSYGCLWEEAIACELDSSMHFYACLVYSIKSPQWFKDFPPRNPCLSYWMSLKGRWYPDTWAKESRRCHPFGRRRSQPLCGHCGTGLFRSSFGCGSSTTSGQQDRPRFRWLFRATGHINPV